jgi:hypothetical protein
MIFIYGKRCYGKVDACGDEHVSTKFFHVWYLPLAPIESYWIVDAGGRGYKIAMSNKSVLAAYLRIWGPLVAVLGLAAGNIGGLIFAAAMAAAAGWSWTHRAQRDPRELRRAQLHRIAIGTGCDPMLMPPDLVARLKPGVDARWAAVADGKSPADVARFGATSAAQAAAAYAALRLAARTGKGAASADARRASDRVLDGITDDDARELAGGPYRAIGANVQAAV